jgi:hypothetical protein
LKVSLSTHAKQGVLPYRVENGRIAESWMEEDLLGSLQQLGAREVPSEPLGDEEQEP